MLERLLSSQRKVNKLLELAKAERGFKKGNLVFIGMADVADYYWCAMKSLFMNKEMESGYFAAYLEDRIEYSSELGLVDEHKLPEDLKALLEIGSGLTLEDVEKLLRKRKQEMEEREVEATISGLMFVDESGDKILAVKDRSKLYSIPDWSEIDKVALPSESGLKKVQEEFPGVEVVDLERYPLVRGEIFQHEEAERYPKIRWNFEWEGYVILGVPDGITDDFVYEYKTTRSNFLIRFVKSQAQIQGDLYGHFFRRPEKKIQIRVSETGETETFREKTESGNALDILKKFRGIDRGGEKPTPPEKWKCRSCKFREKCPITP